MARFVNSLASLRESDTLASVVSHFAYRNANQLEQALSVIERYMPPPDDPNHGSFRNQRDQLRDRIEQRNRRPDLELAPNR